MFRSFVCGPVAFALAFAASAPVAAQSDPQSSSIGEDFTVEFAIFSWKTTPDVTIKTERLDFDTPIDLVSDLGILEKSIPNFKLVLHPARKHRFRVEYLPLHYEAETLLERTIVFNGTVYRIGIPVTSEFDWNAWRFGYEYDFI